MVVTDFDWDYNDTFSPVNNDHPLSAAIDNLNKMDILNTVYVVKDVPVCAFAVTTRAYRYYQKRSQK